MPICRSLRPAAGQYGDRYLPGEARRDDSGFEGGDRSRLCYGHRPLVEPNPIDPEQEQGIEIRVNGVAASINMLTLRYEAWELAPEGDRIILSGVSEGSGGPYPSSKRLKLSRWTQAGPQDRCGRSDQKDLI